MILLKTLVTLKYLPLFLQLSRHKKNTTFGLSPGSYFMISFKLVQLVEMRGVEPLSENIAI